MAHFEGCVVADINYFPALDTPIQTNEWKRRYLGLGDESTRPMIIQDVRHVQREFDLAINGFEFVKLPSRQRVDHSSTEEMIRQDYHPELEALAKRL